LFFIGDPDQDLDFGKVVEYPFHFMISHSVAERLVSLRVGPASIGLASDLVSV